MELDVVTRLRKVAQRLAEMKVAGEVKTKIDSEVRKEFTKGQREAILREQLRAIKKELGDARCRWRSGQVHCAAASKKPGFPKKPPRLPSESSVRPSKA